MISPLRAINTSFPSWILSFVLFIFLLTNSACQNNDQNNQPPIEKDELVEIIMEALLVEPALKEFPKIKQDSFAMQVYEKILSEKGYSTSIFLESMQWLQAEPKRLEEIYEKTLEELVKKEANSDTKVSKIEENKK